MTRSDLFYNEVVLETCLDKDGDIDWCAAFELLSERYDKDVDAAIKEAEELDARLHTVGNQATKFESKFVMAEDRIADLEDKLHDRFVLSFNGYAAANIEEPSPGDLKRVSDAYFICHQERDSLKRRLDKMTKEAEDYRKIASINFDKFSAYKALGDQLAQAVRINVHGRDENLENNLREYEKLGEQKR